MDTIFSGVVTYQDYWIAAFIALVVNLATPIIRRWLIACFTSVGTWLKSLGRKSGKKIYQTRIDQLEEELELYGSIKAPGNFLKWLLPSIYRQILFLWLLVLLPHILDILIPIFGLNEIAVRTGFYALVGMGARYFSSFLIVVNIAQKAVRYEATKSEIDQRIEKLKYRIAQIDE